MRLQHNLLCDIIEGMLWRQIQKTNYTNLDSLLRDLMIEDEKKLFFSQNNNFVLNLPRRLAQKIEKGNIQDPLLLQFLPTNEEGISSGLIDPVQDTDFKKTDCLLHKYQSRALIVTTSACAMHCRYCFRKNFEYKSSDYENEILHIQQDTSLEEILLSGGDPLSLSDEKLFDLLEQLEKIPHVKRIRFHTRFIIGIPERIHEGFLKKLAKIQKQIIFVIHTNHKNELDEEIMLACRELMKLGIPVLSQTVLLKKVNDSLDTLIDLFKHLINHGVIPYYLHQFDPVQGAMHFEVNLEDGLRLHNQLKDFLPGYAVPQYVQEIPGKKSKLPVMKAQ